MDTLQNFYPVYVPDQVLTNKSLNHAFGYLDQQNRYTRSSMIGHGIICGLEYTIINRALTESVDGLVITINAGHGSTIDGLPIQLPAAVNYVAVRRYHLPAVVSDEQLLNPDAVTSVSEKSNTQPKVSNKKLEKAAVPKTGITGLLANSWELIPAGDQTVGEDPVIPLTNFIEEIEGVLFLYLEITDVKSENCSPEDCDDKGKIRTMRVVPLIADRQYFPVQDYSVPQNYPYQTLRLKDYDLQNSAAALYSEYTRVNSWNASYLATRLSIVLQNERNNDYRMGYNGREAETKLIEKLESNFLFTNDARLQYVYDFLYDLSVALNEYVQHHNCQQPTTCSFTSYRYPRVLALGNTSGVNSHLDAFRYRFITAATVEEYHQYKITGFRLYRRLWDMLTMHFAWLSETSIPQSRIEVIPSRSSPAPLGSRAIPYYYKIYNWETFLDSWSAHTCANWTKWDIYGYNAFSTEEILNYCLNEYDFFRIEGHIGQDVNEAERKVNDLIKQKNLPFRTFRLMIKRDIIEQQGPTDKAPVKKLAASSAKLRKSAGIDAASAKATFAGEQFAQIRFANINQYMEDFVKIGLNGTTQVNGSGSGITYTKEQFRINSEAVTTNPKMLTITDVQIGNQRKVVLRVVGTDITNGIGNEIFPGEVYSLQIVYGRNYDEYVENVPAEAEKTKAEKAAAAKAGATANIVQQRPYTTYNFPPVTVIAVEGDTPARIAANLTDRLRQLASASYNLYPKPSDILYSIENSGDNITILLNNPPVKTNLYYITPVVKGVSSSVVHYQSIEYIGGGALLSPVEITVCFRRSDAESTIASKVRMQTGTSLIDFPKDVKPYLTWPQLYEICGVSPLVIDTGGGGEVDSEYNIWPFDAKGNLVFDIFKGAEHLGGVYRGGTFIFLTEMEGDKGTEYEKVVGDISLPWDLEFIKLSRAVSLKFNRKYWKWGNAWETFPPVFTK